MEDDDEDEHFEDAPDEDDEDKANDAEKAEEAESEKAEKEAPKVNPSTWLHRSNIHSKGGRLLIFRFHLFWFHSSPVCHLIDSAPRVCSLCFHPIVSFENLYQHCAKHFNPKKLAFSPREEKRHNAQTHIKMDLSVLLLLLLVLLSRRSVTSVVYKKPD